MTKLLLVPSKLFWCIAKLFIFPIFFPPLLPIYVFITLRTLLQKMLFILTSFCLISFFSFYWIHDFFSALLLILLSYSYRYFNFCSFLLLKVIAICFLFTRKNDHYCYPNPQSTDYEFNLKSIGQWACIGNVAMPSWMSDTI